MPPAVELASSENPLNENSATYQNSEEASPFSLGAEMGVMMGSTNTSLLNQGMNVSPLGRVIVEYVAASCWVFRPSVGYFNTSTTIGYTTLSQSNWEFGISLYYRFPLETSVKFELGLAQRLQLQPNSVPVYGMVSSSSPTLQYTLGPAASMEVPLSGTFALLANGETTFSIGYSTKTYVGLTGGLLIHLH